MKVNGVDGVHPKIAVTPLKIGRGDTLACLLFVVACLVAILWAGSWFWCFFAGAVGGGLVVAATMRAGHRIAESLLPKSAPAAPDSCSTIASRKGAP
jgi:hypothetical protein